MGMQARFKAAVQRQTEIERMVNRIVGANINRVYYIIFGKELNRLMGRHADQTLRNEMEILQRKWSDRGLDTGVLDRIKTAMLPGYAVPIANPFLLDWSLLDGPDVLI